MSILLDALKKAAADKKTTIKKKEIPNATEQVESGSPLELNFSFDGEKNVPMLESESTNQLASDIDSLDLGLKLEASPAIAEKDSSQTLEPLIEEVSEEVSEEPPPLLESSENKVIEKPLPFSLVNEEAGLSLEKENSGTVNQLFEEESSEQLGNKTVKEQIEKENVEDFDWSLSQIPGYSQYDKLPESQKQSKKLLSVFTSQTEKPKKKKREIFLYISFVIIFILGLGYYGLSFYEKQETIIERELKEFQLARVITNNTPTLTLENNGVIVDSVDNASLNELVKKESLVSESVTSLSKQDEPVIESKLDPTLASKEKKNQPNNFVRKPSPMRLEKERKTPSAGEGQQLKIISANIKTKEMLAYDAYQKGDYKTAKKLYQEAFIEDNNSVFALFGLGAIAVKEGEYLNARRYYQQILKLEPQNSQAKLALLSINASLGSQINFEQIMLAKIRKDPENAELKFALGNQFAQKGDWVAAQKQYFNAYSLDVSNAEYALNLAVSLDQLGQYSLAVDYYKKAILLSKESSSLDLSAIKARLDALNRFLGRDL